MPPTQQYIQVVSGDVDYDLNFTLTDASGNPVVLLNVSSMLFNGQSVSDNAVQFSGSMTIANQYSGTCVYAPQSTDFAVSGTYNAQIVVNYQSGEKITFSGIQILAVARIPIS